MFFKDFSKDLPPSRYFAVLGNPIEHSWSPWIHGQFAKHYCVDIDYQQILLPTDDHDFEQWVAEFIKKKGGGLNITLPFKERFFSVMQNDSYLRWVAGNRNIYIPVPMQLGAANTLARHADRSWHALNTDDHALFNAFIDWDEAMESEPQILILGAGGAAHNVLGATLDFGESTANVFIANRNPQRAETLIEDYYIYGGSKQNKERLHYLSIDDSAKHHNQFDMVINATSMGHDTKPSEFVISLQKSSLLKPNGYCFDLSYGLAHKAFKNIALAMGCKPEHLRDGLFMLALQALDAFHEWHPECKSADTYNDNKINALVADIQNKVAAGDKPPKRCLVINKELQEFYE